MDRILEKKGKKKRRTHLVSSPPFDCRVLQKNTHFASPPVKSLRLSGKRFLCLSLMLLYYNIGFPEFPYQPHVLKKNIECMSER
jgi:hypothetical protein